MALSSSGNRFCDFKAWNVEMDVKCSIEEIFVHYEISVDAQKIKVYWPRIRQTYSCDLSVNVAAAVKDYGKEVIIRVLDNVNFDFCIGISPYNTC